MLSSCVPGWHLLRLAHTCLLAMLMQQQASEPKHLNISALEEYAAHEQVAFWGL